MRSGAIQHRMVAQAGPDNPRNDTASVVQLKDGSLLLAWHKYADSDEGEAILAFAAFMPNYRETKGTHGGGSLARGCRAWRS